MREKRITTGNEVLDSMLGGGFLPGQMVVIAGPAGSGKTISALQFIHANLTEGRRCLFISASDSEESIITNSFRFGWDLKQFIDKNLLTIASIKLADALPTLSPDILSAGGLYSSSLEELPKVIKNSKAEIIAIDSITEFNDVCTSELERRTRILNLRRIISEIGATALLVAEVSPDGITTKYGIAEYVADGLILLSRYHTEELSHYLHTIQIIKMRWIPHSREIRVYDITDKGLSIRSPLYTTLASGGKLR